MKHDNHLPLAIIGMACRLPGANNLDEYWKLIIEGRSAVAELPPDRLDRDVYYDPEKGVRCKTYSSIGAVLGKPPQRTETYHLKPEVIANADVSQLDYCHVVSDALRHAQIDPYQVPYRKAGVYIGHTRGTGLGGELMYTTLVEQTAQWLKEIEAFRQLAGERQAEIIDRIVQDVRANHRVRDENGGPFLDAYRVGQLIAQAYQLDGPYMAMNAACASSLMGLAYGSNALQLGHIDMAIVGGASYCKVDSLVLFSKAQSMSATGSRPFDDDADGLIAAEGHVAIVLRRLDDAIADGNPIHAVIRGIGISSDGRGKSLWAPRREGQMEAFHRAYSDTVRADDLQYIEAHATSTPVGDATEVGALAEAFSVRTSQPKKIPIGSVKANIGHTLETAGLAGLVKTVLAMKHRTIPPVINVQNPNSKIDWQSAPFYIPLQPEAWPEQPGGQPRRAGVNAFGIGGLNAHIVLDEYQPETARNLAAIKVPAPADEAIAIIGMASITPGALTLDAFWDLLTSGRSALCDVPSSRWDVDLVHAPGQAQRWRTPVKKGGFITDFDYDWRKHKVPPKQIAAADPLQFMLLDSVDRAMEAAGYRNRPFDGKRTGVIVGSIFGSEFASHLQMGMRLPEFNLTVKKYLRGQHVPEEMLDQLCDQYSDLLLSRMPALEDETGSFTTSTLASRITKTFDLMGGAAAIDSGEVSGITALNICTEMLLSGRCDMMICAAGQRALGLTTFEQYALSGRLSLTGSPDPLSPTSDGTLPGEGVGVVILKRLEDARRDGDQIQAIIRGVGIAREDDSHQALQKAMSRAMQTGKVQAEQISLIEIGGDGAPQRHQVEMAALNDVYGAEPIKGALAGQIGNTQGASGMLSLIKAALSVQHVQAPASSTPLTVRHDQGRVIAGVNSFITNDLAAHVIVERPEPVPVTQAKPAVSKTTQPVTRHNPAVDTVSTVSSTTRTTPYRVVAVDAATMSELASRAESIVKASQAAWNQHCQLGPEAYRLAIVASSPEELSQKAGQFVKHFESDSSRSFLANKGIYWGTANTNGKLAFLFPGQGSQYAGMLEDYASRNAVGRTIMGELDAMLERRGYPAFKSLVQTEAELLGRDVWRTQLSLLVTEALLFRAVTNLGIRPDRLTAHSFGEFSALYAAGAFDFENAALATFYRCRCIEECTSVAGAMLSCQTDTDTVQQFCDQVGNAFVANSNSQRQTVIGGTQHSLTQVAELLTQAGITTRMIDVPRPFHTPLMETIRNPFRQALNQVHIEPPRTPLLSSVSRTYIADPDQIRDHLAIQLTTPVMLVDQIRRLETEGVTLFVEIGPRQVLTRLAEDILAGSVPVVSTDAKNRPTEESLARVAAQATALGFLSAPCELIGPETVAQPPQKISTPVSGTLNTAPTTTLSATPPTGSPSATKSNSKFNSSRIAVLHVSGTPYELGYAHGSAQKSVIRRALRLYCDLPDRAGKQLPDISQTLNRLDTLFTPREREEIQGIADGAGVMVENLIAHNIYVCPDISGGCSQLAATADVPEVDSLIHAANEDLPLGLTLREKLVRMVQVRKPTGKLAYVTFVVAGHVGGINGVNAAGLAITSSMLLDLPRHPDQHSGLLHSVLVSRILESCTTIEQAIELLKEHQGCGAWGVCISHAQTNRVQYLEYDGQTVRIDEQRPYLLATNHAQLLTGELPPAVHSACRIERLEQLWDETRAQGRVTPEKVQHWLRDRSDIKRGRTTRFPTMNTMLRVDNQVSIVMEPGKARLWATSGPYAGASPDEYVEFDLEDLIGLKPLSASSRTEPVAENVATASQAATLKDHPAAQNVPVSKSAAGSDNSHNLVIDRAEYVQLNTSVDGHSPRDASSKICNRFVVRLLPGNELPTDNNRLEGRALIIGDNRFARQLAAHLQATGNDAYVLTVHADAEQSVAELNEQWQHRPFQHVFLMTALDDDALQTLEAEEWNRRRQLGLISPYQICQRWFELALELPSECQRTIVTCTRLGGELAFGDRVGSPEAGAMAGLVKALKRELYQPNIDWGCTKVLDFEDAVDPQFVAVRALNESTHELHETEMTFREGKRFLVRAINEPAELFTAAAKPISGPWVITGGARGVTAAVALGIGKQHGANLHLIGSSPIPTIQPEWLNYSDDQLKQLRAEIMKQAVGRKEIPVEAWSRIEKAIEIEKNLQGFRENGISVTYHSCDVGDRAALRQVLESIRQQEGPIQAVVHGAGYEKAARYHKKKMENVHKTIRAKVDGAAALMELTQQDPLKVFLAFGSVSGRFGGTGQTDYSLANEMLSKLVAWYRQQRPEVPATVFAWHSWDEVGMAVRPETKHSAVMAYLRNMPPREGTQHLLDEISIGCPTSEVVITDWKYYKFFYPDLPAEKQPVQPHQLPATEESDCTKRYILRMKSLPTITDRESLKGASIIIGVNAVAQLLANLIRSLGGTVTLIPTEDQTPEELAKAIREACSQQFAPHLFITTSLDADATDIFEPQVWAKRRQNGVLSPYRACQEWYRLYCAQSGQATLTAAVNLGGDFGMQQAPNAPESGALTGLLKCIHVESQRKDGPAMQVRLVDSSDLDATRFAQRVLDETLNVDKSTPVEVGYLQNARVTPHAVQEDAVQADQSDLRPIPAGSHWIAFGGGRGITSKCALIMAKKYGIQVHLVGSSALPDMHSGIALLNQQERELLKKQTTQEALSAGELPKFRCEQLMKTFEIIDTYREFEKSGIPFRYYQCDIRDKNQLSDVLDQIRKHGEITGILQGAGVTAQRRFEDKPMHELENMIGVKIDATLSLIDLTRNDPVQFFASFGSISGRHGANGYTDYSIGADMICKITSKLRHIRPEICAVSYHWHAWGEVGMLMRPRSFGSRSLMKLQLMPTEEGTRHLTNELLLGGPEAEVMLTTNPEGEHVAPDKAKSASSKQQLLLIDSHSRDGETLTAEITFRPQEDPFLRDHHLKGRPILPMVIGIEALVEATLPLSATRGEVIRMQNFRVIEPMRLLGDQPATARVRCQPLGNRYTASLSSDFCNASGKLLKPDRLQMTGEVQFGPDISFYPVQSLQYTPIWNEVEYPDEQFVIYHGQSMRCLKKMNKDTAMLVVPPSSLLAGNRKRGEWQVAPNLLDACFYAMGIVIWANNPQLVALPHSLAELLVGNIPAAGEECFLKWNILQRQPNSWTFDFDLFNAQGDVFIQARGYETTIFEGPSA